MGTTGPAPSPPQRSGRGPFALAGWIVAGALGVALAVLLAFQVGKRSVLTTYDRVAATIAGPVVASPAVPTATLPQPAATEPEQPAPTPALQSAVMEVMLPTRPAALEAVSAATAEPGPAPAETMREQMTRCLTFEVVDDLLHSTVPRETSTQVRVSVRNSCSFSFAGSDVWYEVRAIQRRGGGVGARKVGQFSGGPIEAKSRAELVDVLECPACYEESYRYEARLLVGQQRRADGMRTRAPASKKATRERPWTASQAERTLAGPGGIARLLKTLAKAWPEGLADFEAVFDLIVRRCRNEFGAGRFLAYLCRALLHEQAYQKIRSTVPPLKWAFAAERVNLAAFEAFQAPSFANDVLLARELAEVVHDPGPPLLESADGRIRPDEGPLALERRRALGDWLLEMQSRAALAAGKKLLHRPGGPRRVKGVKRSRKPSKPDPSPSLDRLRGAQARARSNGTLESTISGGLGLPQADAAKVAEWDDPDRIAAALLAAEEDPSLVGKSLAAIRAAERHIRARERRWSLYRAREKTDIHLSHAKK